MNEEESLEKEQESPKRYLGKAFLKMLWAFVIPAFSLWFFQHAVSRYDRDIARSVVSHVQNVEDSAFGQYLQKRPVSQILAGTSPEEEEMRRAFAKAKGDYDFFALMRKVAAVCLLLALAALVVGGLAAAFSRRSPAWQFWSLSSGWWVLRIVAVLEVIGQGVLAVALSYWLTALWMDVYSIKIILLVGILAVVGVALIGKAIFAGTDQPPTVDGKVFPKDQSPALWNHIRGMAGSFSIPEPDNIILGVDDNFFVTEQPLQLGKEIIRGRSLYLSLALLKIMDKEEADAVLAHELAHFSGKDTFHSRRIAPILKRHAVYLEALARGGITIPIFHFMHFFWLLFQLSLNKVSREREFLADHRAAETTSPEAIGRALVKIASYSKYRLKVEQDLFGLQQKHTALNLASSLEVGYVRFALQETDAKALCRAKTAHPFDSHPPLAARLQAVGITPSVEFFEDSLQSPVQNSWREDIEGAEEMENALWSEYEEGFRKQHAVVLPYRVLPTTEEEEKIVLEEFPEVELTSKKGSSLRIRHSDIWSSEWNQSIPYSAITEVGSEKSIRGYHIIEVKHTVPGVKKPKGLKLKLKDYPATSEQIMASFNRYLSRYKVAEEYLKEQPSGPASES